MNPFNYMMPFMQFMNTQNSGNSQNPQNAQGFFGNNNMSQNPFAQMWQMPFPNPFAAAGSDEANGAADAKTDAQSQNAFYTQMNQFMEMFKNMSNMWGMNLNNMNMNMNMNQFMNQYMNQFMNFMNPWNYCQLFMTAYTEMMMQFFSMCLPYVDKLKDMFKSDGASLMGLPVEALRFLLNIDSSPDGLSKFQKILDIIFDLYSNRESEEGDLCSEKAVVSEQETKENPAEVNGQAFAETAEDAVTGNNESSCNEGASKESSSKEGSSKESSSKESLSKEKIEAYLNDPDIPPFVKKMITANGSAAFGKHDITYYIEKYGKKK